MLLDPAQQRLAAAAAVVLAYAALCVAVFLRERRRRARTLADAVAMGAHGPGGSGPMLIAYASQTGFAEQLAWQAARWLHTAGVASRVLPLGPISADELASFERALFIVSTYGEGDPPDNGARFGERVMASPARLAGLHHAVLALGDSTYANFCGFGRRLDAWLLESGAAAMFERIEVDNDDAIALNQWQHEVGRLAGTTDLPDWQAPVFAAWRLIERRLLNKGSHGAPMFHLELEPADGQPLPDWQAGDLVQVRVPPASSAGESPNKPREYTISSLPSEGRLQLLVRQERRTDGSAGLASGWLTVGIECGQTIDLRLRPHSSFRIGENAGRPLILIGNGTGLAGLRAHLKARVVEKHARQSIQPVWLVFGERHSAHDSLYAGEIAAWRANGVLAHVDLVFSRDQAERRYVQHELLEQQDRLREWIANGAAIYVCGSLQGMATEVNAALQAVLGADELARLSDAQRYRRDVY